VGGALMSEFFKVSERFVEPHDAGYLGAHRETSERLEALVGDERFEHIAKLRKSEGWSEAKHQACEDYARHLLLVSDNDPLASEARSEVIRRFENHLGRGASSSHGVAVH